MDKDFITNNLDYLLDKLDQENPENNIKKDIKNKIAAKTDNLIDYFNQLNDNKKIYYVLLVCVLYIILNYFKVSTASIFALIISGGLGYYFFITDKSSNDDSFDNLNFKIEALNKITNRKNRYLYTDIEIVEIFSNLIDIRGYSVSDFDESLYNANQFLKLIYHLDINAQPSGYIIQNAEILSKNCLNLLKNLFYNCENIEKYDKKIGDSLLRLQKLFDNYLKKYSSKSDNENLKNISINSTFINNIDSPSPNDIQINGGSSISNRYNIFNNRF
jgi:hypothetical protein